MTKTFEERLIADTYREDVVCHLRLDPDSRDEKSEPKQAWVSERLLARLKHLGLAYELPLLARLPLNGEFSYPEVQLMALEDELAFLSDVVADSALLSAAALFQDLIRHGTHHPRGWSLVVEAP